MADPKTVKFHVTREMIRSTPRNGQFYYSGVDPIDHALSTVFPDRTVGLGRGDHWAQYLRSPQTGVTIKVPRSVTRFLDRWYGNKPVQPFTFTARVTDLAPTAMMMSEGMFAPLY